MEFRQECVTYWEKQPVMMQNARGEWVPAIPLPLQTKFGRAQCDEVIYADAEGGVVRCGRKFWELEAYRAHYALEHILAGK
jgi:hypothetical protein